jgi:hypothetical protein
MDRLIEYNFEVYYQLGKSNLIGIANGLSRLPSNLQEEPIRFNIKRLAFASIVEFKPPIARPFIIVTYASS